MPRCVVTPHGGALYMRSSLLSPAAHDIADVVGVRRRCIPRHLNFVLDRARPPQRCPSPVSALVFRRDRPRARWPRDGLTTPLNRSKLTSRGAGASEINCSPPPNNLRPLLRPPGAAALQRGRWQINGQPIVRRVVVLLTLCVSAGRVCSRRGRRGRFLN